MKFFAPSALLFAALVIASPASLLQEQQDVAANAAPETRSILVAPEVVEKADLERRKVSRPKGNSSGNSSNSSTGAAVSMTPNQILMGVVGTGIAVAVLWG